MPISKDFEARLTRSLKGRTLAQAGIGAKTGLTVIAIDLDESVSDTDEAWDEVREALDVARAEFPSGVSEPWLNAKMSTDHDAVVLAITGSPEPTELLAAARDVELAPHVEVRPQPLGELAVEDRRIQPLFILLVEQLIHRFLNLVASLVTGIKPQRAAMDRNPVRAKD